MSSFENSSDRRLVARPTYELASWGQRFGAHSVDLLINLIPAAALFWLLNKLSVTHGHFGPHLTITEYDGGAFVQHVYGLDAAGWAVWLLLLSPYWGVCMRRPGSDNGQTIGKRRFGVRVVANDGGPITGFIASARVLIMGVMWMAFVLPGLIDCLWPLWDPEGRALHDIFCGTHVVQTDKPASTWTPNR